MRRGLVAAAVGLLLCLPSAAFAQEGPEGASDTSGVGEASSVERDPAQSAETGPDETGPDEVGIGDSDDIECRGTVTASVVDLDGAAVDGAMLAVAGEQLRGSGSVESTCGEVAATLLAAPDGYAPAGPTSLNVQVRRTAPTHVTFTVDPVEVLGVQFEQPAEAPAAPAAPQVQDQADAAPAELAATGPEDAPTLLLLALVCGLLGTVLLAAAPATARRPTSRT